MSSINIRSFLDKNAIVVIFNNLKYFSTYQYYNKRALTGQIVLVGVVGLVSLSWIT